MEENSPWVPQEDGTVLPSAELAKAYRENPDQFPHFMEDAVALTGKTQEEIQAIIDNPLADGGYLSGPVVGPIAKVATMPDVRRGLAQGGAFLAENLGFEGVGETLRDYADSTNPEFATERDLGENLAEVAGQAAPAVGAAMASGGGVLIPALVGAGVSTLTFDSEDNLANAINGLADGAVPDELVVREDDTPEKATLKSLTVNFLTDLALAGAGRGLGKLVNIYKEVPNGFVDMNTLKKMSDETGVPLREEPTLPSITPKLVEESKVPTATRVARREKASAESLRTRIENASNPVEVKPVVIKPEVTREFLDDVEHKVRVFEDRTMKTTDFGRLGDDLKADFRTHAAQVEAAVQARNSTEIERLLKQGAQFKRELQAHEMNSVGVYNTILTKTALDNLSSDFKNIVLEIRRNPDQTTRSAINKVAREQLEQIGGVWDFYRSLGTGASHQLLIRKGLGKGDDVLGDIASDLSAAADEVTVLLKERGITMYDTENTFVAKKILAYDEAGIDPSGHLEEIFKAFEEYEKLIAGAKANMKQKAKLTPLEELGMIAKGVQFVKDLQSTMLLGQFMTAGTEFMSTGMNTLILPALKAVGGGSKKRWAREMAGLMHGTSLARTNALTALKFGKDKVDDFFLKEGSFSRILDGERMLKEGKYAQYLTWKLFTIAVDVAQASTAFFKTARAYGLAYADGYEVAIKSGMTPAQAKKSAQEFATSRFDPEGAIIDEDFRTAAAESAFQQVFDGSTMTGKLGQWVENMRNSQAAYGLGGLAARAAMPFFRTLTNIGHSSFQMIMPPGTAIALKRIYPEGTHVARFLDDFTGKNGEVARRVAIGRNRVGAAMTLGAFGLTQMPGIEITGPSRGQRWDAKKRSFEEFPASSIIIGNTAFDLTRLLPFSAPLMIAGVLRDYQLEDALRMEGGEYDPTDSTLEYLGNYMSGLGVTMLTLMQDAGATRGIFDLMDAVFKAVDEGDAKALTQYGQSYAMQFTPGPLKMAGKAVADVQYEGYTFWDRWKAQTGLKTQWERLDFFGNPIHYPSFKGIDPSNRRLLRLDDPAYAEFAFLNKMEDLALVTPRPDTVFGKADWDKIGVRTEGVFGSNTPSLDTMKLKDGRNAWEVYRKLLYEAKAGDQITKKVPNMELYVSVEPGENFESAVRRMIGTEAYQQHTPDSRKVLWNTLYGIFKEEAKDYLKGHLVVDPSTFNESRFGSPLIAPATMGETLDAGKALGAQIKSTQGNPLDDIFAIK